MLEASKRLPKPMSRERLLDSHEAAEMLRVHPRTLQRLAHQGLIAGVQVGKLWRFRESTITEWIDRKLVG
jgi:excisionase family DNA binding protein